MIIRIHFLNKRFFEFNLFDFLKLEIRKPKSCKNFREFSKNLVKEHLDINMNYKQHIYTFSEADYVIDFQKNYISFNLCEMKRDSKTFVKLLEILDALANKFGRNICVIMSLDSRFKEDENLKEEILKITKSYNILVDYN